MASSTIVKKPIHNDGGDGMDLSDEDSEEMFRDDDDTGEREKSLDSKQQQQQEQQQQQQQKVVDPILLQHAKKRLSKWAARLFDPDRPKGLVEPPQTIPLNDEFLSAFGKRERDYDKQIGRNIQVNQTIDSDDDDDADDEGLQQRQQKKEEEEEERRTKSKQQQQ